MAKDKLETLRKLAARRQLALGIELQKLRAQRVEQEAQAQSLQEMLGAYHNEAQDSPSPHASQLAMFSRFYARVTQTLSSHDTHLQRLREAEHNGELSFHEAYRDHQAITRLQQKRAQQQALTLKRKERRSDGARRWSMLNRTEEERKN